MKRTTYDLPFFADDLNPGERFRTSNHAQTTSQKYAYDVTMGRLKRDGSWTSLKAGVKNHWDNPKNASYLVWGKPVYAITDGLIIGGWRRGPNNPRPKLPTENKNDIASEDREWLHQSYRDGLLPGGGNELWILNDDGTRTLYAHFQRDSIPPDLCPKTKTVFDAPKSNSDAKDENGMSFQIALEPRDRRRVKAGQFLGRVGHSGSSTGPHLHFHTENQNASGNWVAEPMKFSRGLSTPWDRGKADINKWSSFSGKKIPNGGVLFWPPTRLTSEYARHKFPAHDMGRMFEHLSNSGFMPEVMDCYRVGSRTFYNMVWRPADGSWRGYYGQTGTKLKENYKKAKADGYRMTYLESCLAGRSTRYVSVFKKTSGAYLWKHGRTPAEHQADFDQAKKDGFRPFNVSVVSKNGARRITALYRKESLGSWSANSFMTEDQYQKAVNDNQAAKRIPFYVNAYMHEGSPHFSAIFASEPSGSWKARHDMTVSGYQTEWQSAMNAGQLTRTIAGYDGAKGNHKYAAVWRK